MKSYHEDEGTESPKGKKEKPKYRPSYDGAFDEDDLRAAGKELNDYGNARRLIDRYGGDMLYEPSNQKRPWLAWNGKTWVRNNGAVRLLAHNMQQRIKAEAAAAFANGAHPAVCVALEEWAAISGNTSRINGALSESVPYCEVGPFDLDADGFVLPCANGTLEFHIDEADPESGSSDRQGRVVFREHRRDDKFTKMAAVEYDPAATCPRFEKLLADMQKPEGTRRLLQQFYGLTVTGHTVQKVLMNHGGGANGKSTIVGCIRDVLGDFAVHVKFDSLCENDRASGAEATPDVISMVNARMVTAAEPRAGAKLSDDVIKGMTGDDTVAARQLYSEMFNFMPTHKLSLAMNRKPKIRSNDHGTWRRIILVEWSETIPEAQQVEKFTNRLVAAEGSGILNWLVAGWLDWVENGLVIPEAVRESTRQYRILSNPIQEFIAMCLERTEPHMMNNTAASKIYNCYTRWCAIQPMEPMNKTAFGNAMADEFEKTKVGNVYYRNVRIRPDLDFMGDGDGGVAEPRG